MKLKMMARFTVALALLLFIGRPTRTMAIPAFARKYHTTCARCHTAEPRLNNYGWNFKLRGYHVPGDEEAGKIVSKDDPFLNLLRQIPIAVHASGAIQQSNTSGMNPDFAPNQYADLILADTLAPRMGMFMELETQKNAGDNRFTSDIGNIRLMFTDLLRRQPTALNLEVGRFNPDEFGISDGRRLTLNHYAIYDLGTNPIGANPFPWEADVAGFNIYGAFDTGIGVEAPAKVAAPAATAAPVSNAELNALQHELETQPAAPVAERPEVTATRATLDVLVKKGMMTQEEEDTTLSDLAAKLGPAPSSPETSPATPEAEPAEQPISKTDYDVRKGLLYQAGLVTPGIESRNRYQFFGRLALASAANWWISPVVYLGSQGLSQYAAPPPGQPAQFNDVTQRLGIEGSFSTGPRRDVAGVSRHALDLQAAVMHGSDNNADGLGHDVKFDGGFVEGAYLINDRNLGILRWDRVSAPLPVGYVSSLPAGTPPGLDVSSITANYTHYLRRNVKAGVEYVLDLQHSNSIHQNSSQWAIFYDFVF